MKINRRDAIKTFAAGCLGCLLLKNRKAFGMAALNCDNDKCSIMKRNELGRTGLKVSQIAFGGIIVMNEQPETAAQYVKTAIEKGVNYFDVAPSYGNAEQKLGPALEPFRKDVYLASKSHDRTAKGTKELLDNSLKNLKTDYFDLYQLHAITDVEKDVKACFAKDGAMETILDAKKNGIIRNIGFSAHSPEAALAAMNEFDFDTVMYPVNFCTHFNSCFECEVLKEAKKQKMGIIALKAIAKQKWQAKEDKKKFPKCWYEPIDDKELARLALSWTLEQQVPTTVSPGQWELLAIMLEVYNNCGKLSEAEMDILKKTAQNCQPIFT
jgi:aryl-alcohol dehydrogenase-like predicted oxidoreductase